MLQENYAFFRKLEYTKKHHDSFNYKDIILNWDSGFTVICLILLILYDSTFSFELYLCSWNALQ